MGVASTPTLLPLDSFARHANINPIHFNGVYLPDLAEQSCGNGLTQYSWQAFDRVSREEVAQAIADAELLIMQNLRYPLAPMWVADEKLQMAQPANPTLLYGVGRDIRGFNLSVKTDWGYVISGGREQKTIIDDAAAVVYSNTLASFATYLDTATVTVATTVTDPEEIAVFYPGLAGDPAWEIKPIKVSIAAGTAVITFQRAQCILKSILEDMAWVPVLGTDDSKFLTTVDVYRKYNDASVQAIFATDNACSCGLSTCETCGYSVQTGCATVKNDRLGLVSLAPGTWDATDEVYTTAYWTDCRSADRVRLWYRAGWRNMSLATPNLTMDAMWARAVTYLALALLDRPLCGCEALRAFTAHWKEDLGINVSNQAASSSVQLGTLLNNPIGTTRGAIYAWRLVQRNALGENVNAK